MHPSVAGVPVHADGAGVQGDGTGQMVEVQSVATHGQPVGLELASMPGPCSALARNEGLGDAGEERKHWTHVMMDEKTELIDEEIAEPQTLPLYKRPFRCVERKHDECGLGGTVQCTCTPPPRNRCSDVQYVLLSSENKVKGSTRLRTLMSTVPEWQSRKEHDRLMRYLTKLQERYSTGTVERTGIEATISVLKSHLIRVASKGALFEMCRAWGIKSCIWQHKDGAKRGAQEINKRGAQGAYAGTCAPVWRSTSELSMSTISTFETGKDVILRCSDGSDSEVLSGRDSHCSALSSESVPMTSLNIYGDVANSLRAEDVGKIFLHHPNIKLDMILSFDAIHTSRLLDFVKAGSKIPEAQIDMVLRLYGKMMCQRQPPEILMTSYFGGRPPKKLPKHWRSLLLAAWNRRFSVPRLHKLQSENQLSQVDILIDWYIRHDATWSERSFCMAVKDHILNVRTRMSALCADIELVMEEIQRGVLWVEGDKVVEDMAYQLGATCTYLLNTWRWVLKNIEDWQGSSEEAPSASYACLICMRTVLLKEIGVHANLFLNLDIVQEHAHLLEVAEETDVIHRAVVALS